MSKKNLRLSSETIRVLEGRDLDEVAAGRGGHRKLSAARGCEKSGIVGICETDMCLPGSLVSNCPPTIMGVR